MPFDPAEKNAGVELVGDLPRIGCQQIGPAIVAVEALVAVLEVFARGKDRRREIVRHRKRIARPHSGRRKKVIGAIVAGHQNISSGSHKSQ